MASTIAAKGLTITNPLVLYRALIATNKIRPDQAQHRLAIHLQKLYENLKDYEPAVEYSKRLEQISKTINGEAQPSHGTGVNTGLGRKGIWRSLLEGQEKQDSLSLTRTLTSRELARSLNSPKGLMLHGEVGTGKSMLIDLFADCLPHRKKRRWHFNTFILDVIASLEQLRSSRMIRASPISSEDSSMLLLARDLVTKSPILFLDEFQLPDRAASKIMTNLMTAFFQLGGVLIATSNRMPEELNKAAGVTYTAPPTRMESLRWRFGLESSAKKGRSENLFAGQGEFAEFLDVLKARCDIWEMEGKEDYRRLESGTKSQKDKNDAILDDPNARYETEGSWLLDDHVDLQRIKENEDNDDTTTPSRVDSAVDTQVPASPKHYHILQAEDAAQMTEALKAALSTLDAEGRSFSSLDYRAASMTVYGRQVPIPRAADGVCHFTFTELCTSSLGAADYLTLASAFHTFILTDVPVLTLLRKNEARRFITLLDALYEARCKLLITATAGPDDLFFPDQAPDQGESTSSDSVYSETLSEAYQDATSPFRPNILSSNPAYAETDTHYDPKPEPDYTHSRLAGMLAPDALEDDPPNRVLRARERDREREAGPIDPDATRVRRRGSGVGPDFGATGAFTGEDERFAYKRARSRLWEMCGARWWARSEDGWHRPLPKEVRRWEGSAAEREAARAATAEMKGLDEAAGAASDAGMGASRLVDERNDEIMFRHGASPFRTSREPPPKFSWTHVWGTVKWGKKAGTWGQGVEGLEERQREKDKGKGGREN